MKGKTEPLPAYRLLAARAASERRHETVFVGRERELALLGEAWDAGAGGAIAASWSRSSVTRVSASRGWRRRRWLDRGAGRSRPLPALRGGITYWPVVEVLKQLDATPVGSGRRGGDPLAARRESEAGTSAEEIAWAFRKLLEEQAPLVVVFDDIQWGEETFLDLVEHVALLSSRRSVLLVVCMARPELLESRPSWPVTVRLEPLGSEEAASLIGSGVAGGAAREDRGRGRRQPALHRRDAGDGR